MATLTEGDTVEYVDEYGSPHLALVTANWGTREDFDVEIGLPPSINVVYVGKDAAKRDSYGHQIERATSVVHEKNQAAHGRYWRFLK